MCIRDRVSGKLRQPLSKNLRQYKNPHKGAQQQRPACQQHRRLFCHKKQGYGDPGHGVPITDISVLIGTIEEKEEGMLNLHLVS